MLAPRKKKTRPIAASLAIHGDPTAEQAFACTLAWAAAVWRATVAPAAGRPTLPELRQAWQGVSQPGNWAATRGPISAMMLELRRAGMAMPTAFTIEFDPDHIFGLTEEAPGLLAKHLRAKTTELD